MITVREAGTQVEISDGTGNGTFVVDADTAIEYLNKLNKLHPGQTVVKVHRLMASVVNAACEIAGLSSFAAAKAKSTGQLII
jgi:hypothetical protein